MPKTKPLKRSLAFTFILSALIPIIALSFLVINHLTGDTVGDIAEKNLLLARAVSGQVEVFLREPLSALHTIRGLLLSFPTMSDFYIQRILDTHVRDSDLFDSIYILDKEGKVQYVGLSEFKENFRNDFLGIDLSHKGFYREARRAGKPTWSDTFLSLISGEMSLALCFPLDERVLVGNFSIEILSRFTGTLNVGDRVKVTVVDRQGSIIVHPDPVIAARRVKVRHLPVIRAGLAGHEGTHQYTFEDEKYIGSIALIPGPGWAALVSQTTRDAYGHIRHTGLIFAGGAIGAILLSFLFAFLKARNVTLPLSDFTSRTKVIASGEYTSELPSQKYSEIEGLAESFRDMASAIQHREKEIIKSEERYRMLVETMNDGIIIVNKEGRLTYANPRLCTLLGYSYDEISGRKISDFFDNTNQKILENQLARRRRGEADVYEIEWTHQTGNKICTIMSPVPLYSNSEFVGSFAVITDISERKKLENQLLHSQKMEAVGQLAGGIAHDFNNILTAIISYSYLTKNKLDMDSPLNDNLDKILSLSDRASQITRGLLTFSRRQHVELKPINLNEVVRSVEKLISKFIGEEIIVMTKLSGEEPAIIADRIQLEQILINLATNARDAMPDGGSLIIETGRVEFDGNFTSAHDAAKPGVYTALTVSDTGTGMDRETTQKIFEPFYTTKEVGKGTGLGLAIIYGIVKEHDGHITVYSELGKGTTFRIYFPTVKGLSREREETVVSDLTGNGQYILVAEDEAPVRQSIKTVLEESGYNVVEAESGKDAIENFIRNKNNIQLLVLDVVMPGMNGNEAFKEIRKVNPEIKVIFTSGYTADIIERKKILEKDVVLLSKPLSPANLLLNIKEVLEG